MSASLLASNGKPYPYLQAIHEDGTVNENFIQRTGLPFFTATNYLVQIFSSITLTSSISHAALNNYHIVGPLLTKSKSLEKVDPHRIACQKYKDLPSWGFVVIVLVAVTFTCAMSSISKFGISVAGLLAALSTSFLMTLAL
ncbi:hypothetical protein PCASD_02594 [Puccinia coronata f. sp. avenae]|uniref:Uncharacterized protein n=1 Tax=Puccinia coronata f. sp. avenae TaxID=200324 RepID=A0A2N5VBF0_9BASI|nr:hypothetical protein PCASD_02594 [Puccinia coronata f. sp. avenae]